MKKKFVNFLFQAGLVALLAIGLGWSVLSADRSAEGQAAEPEKAAEARASELDLNHKVTIEEIKSRTPKPLIPGPTEGSVARLTSRLLAQSHYLQQALDDTTASKFLDRYIETLDPLHIHFLQSDLDEFEPYRVSLDDLTSKGETRPGRLIFSRFLERVGDRMMYVNDLLANEKFEFNGNDRYNLDRKKVAWPKDLDEAKNMWRQHLRYEVLQERLNKAKPEEISSKINTRYARLWRTLKDYDADDVFELYLSSLTRVYDPHSDYLGKSQLENFAIGMKLSLFGIGALLQSEDGYCKIVSLMPGGPAALSGKIKENDRVIAVGQGETSEPVDVFDMKLNKIVEMIRGPENSTVRLVIIPADATDPSTRKEVKLRRQKIKLEDSEAKARIYDLPSEDGKTHRIGLIDLPSFYADFNIGNQKNQGEGKSTTADVAKLLQKLKQEKVEGVILDLRRNGGGFLEEAISLTGLFIKKGPVVQVKGPNGKPSVDEDTDSSLLYDGPLMVLTSRFSASASEILAGALQDYGRALVVGDASTHGKGTVQSLIELEPYLRRALRPNENPGAVKLTIRKFYRASGSSTQLKGVIPDVVLPSINNYAEVGEASLDNPLPWDTIPSVPHDKLQMVQTYVPEIQKLSEQRIRKDQDFAYMAEDIERMKQLLADKSVSLNEEERKREKAETEAREKKRQTELAARPESNEKIYEITLKLAQTPGLPEPLSKTNLLALAKKGHVNGGVAPVTDPDEKEDEAAEEEAKVPPVDATLKEAKRMLIDYVAMLRRDAALAVKQ